MAHEIDNLENVAKHGNPWSKVKDDWETPSDLFLKLNAEFDFDLDVAANAQNAKCPNYIPYPEVDALQADWSTYGKRAFMNPPYSNWTPWAAKAMLESQRPKSGILVVGLLPVDTSTRAFHRYIYGCPNASIRFIERRLRFWYNGQPGPSPARFASMVVIWHPSVIVRHTPDQKQQLANNLASVRDPIWVVKK